MKTKPASTRLSLFIVSLSIVWNAAGRPTDPKLSVPERTKPSPMLAGEAQAPSDPMVIHNAMLKQMNGTNELMMQAEPRWKLGTNTLVTGLIVDGFEPKQTWKMLNPLMPANSAAKLPLPIPQSLKPARIVDNSLAEHEADFAILRFSLGSPPKATKSAP